MKRDKEWYKGFKEAEKMLQAGSCVMDIIWMSSVVVHGGVTAYQKGMSDYLKHHQELQLIFKG